MSNEYKDWIYDRVTEAVLAKGKLDWISRVLQRSTGFHYVYGLKHNRLKAYKVWLDEEGIWQCEDVTEEEKPYEDDYELCYQRGWQHGYTTAQNEVHEELARKIQQLTTANEYLRNEIVQMRTEMIASQRGW